MIKAAVTIVSAQVPTETRVELERRAEAGYRSISAEIRLALDEHLRDPPDDQLSERVRTGCLSCRPSAGEGA